MFLRPILICAAGVLALQLLTVRADSGVNSLEIPKGWSASISIGRQYFMGYDSREKAYFIKNMEPIGPIGRLINADTVPSPGGHHVPYSARGMRAEDLWTASLLESVDAAPFHNRKLRFQADIKSSDFRGKFDLMLRAVAPSEGEEHNSTSGAPPGQEWQTTVVEIEDVPASGILAFGFLQQGEGRVLIRNIKLTELDPAPKAPKETPLWSMFDLPRAEAQPVNVEMRR